MKARGNSFERKATKNPLFLTGLWSLLDFAGLASGGGGGSRTRVRKPSAGASTCVAFVLETSRRIAPSGRIFPRYPVRVRRPSPGKKFGYPV